MVVLDQECKKEALGDGLLNIVSEDENLLVINKPAGLVCHPTKGDEFSSLISRARLYLGTGEPPHLVNRLDRETSGLVVIAKNVETAALLRKKWFNREIDKQYLAITHGHVPSEALFIDAPLGADEESEVAIKDRVHEDGAAAQTAIFVTKRFVRNGQPFTLLKVHPLTGRKHQIRIHLQHIGHPIVGDKMYGLDGSFYLKFVEDKLTEEEWSSLIFRNQALHAQTLEYTLNGVRKSYYCAPEQWFQEFASI